MADETDTNSGSATDGTTGGSVTDAGGESVTDPTGMDDVELWKSRSRDWEKRSKDNANAIKERDEYKRQLDELEQQSKSEHERQLDSAVREAEDRVRGEVLTVANERLVRASVRVAAAGQLADAEDAIRFLDLNEIQVDEDGEVDSKVVSKAIEDLLKAKPYLAGKSKSKVNFDQGARQTTARDDDVSGTSRLARAYADNASARSKS